MLRLMIGRAGCGKTTELLRRLVEAGKSRPQILLVPEQQSHEAGTARPSTEKCCPSAVWRTGSS